MSGSPLTLPPERSRWRLSRNSPGDRPGRAEVSSPWLLSTSVSDIGEAERISKSYVSRILRLALLAPEIVEAIRRKLLDDGHIDTVIGLPANLFYSTGIPVCVLVLKKCRKPHDVLFINATEHFEGGKRQNYLSDEHIEKIIDTYQQRPESMERYARRVEMDEIEANDFNLNISSYVSTAKQEVAIDLSATHRELVEKQIQEATAKHNAFLKELGLSVLPAPDQ